MSAGEDLRCKPEDSPGNHASMRPRHFCRGRSGANGVICRTSKRRFNEAPAFLPGKMTASLIPLDGLFKLQ